MTFIDKLKIAYKEQPFTMVWRCLWILPLTVTILLVMLALTIFNLGFEEAKDLWDYCY